ncbi:hypothetical protein CPC16_003504 [Podila verticillata]|nr:hypothetical protein CPC16_003504 [Podila verticillata]
MISASMNLRPSCQMISQVPEKDDKVIDFEFQLIWSLICLGHQLKSLLDAKMACSRGIMALDQDLTLDLLISWDDNPSFMEQDAIN